jgi:hypothetical protein
VVVAKDLADGILAGGRMSEHGDDVGMWHYALRC